MLLVPQHKFGYEIQTSGFQLHFSKITIDTTRLIYYNVTSQPIKADLGLIFGIRVINIFRQCEASIYKYHKVVRTAFYRPAVIFFAVADQNYQLTKIWRDVVLFT